MKIEPGTVSHGTLRTQDLLDAFTGYMHRVIMPSLDHESSDWKHLNRIIRDAEQGFGDPAWYDSDESSELVETAIDALDGFAPFGHYFGAHPGDGSDFGYWPSDEYSDWQAARESLPRYGEGSDLAGQLQSYAWPGGYPILYLDSHNETLCPHCANKAEDDSNEVDPENRAHAYYVHYEGPPETCAECDSETESAYGDPDAPIRIKLDNLEDRDGCVLITCDDPQAARRDQSIAGSMWEIADGLAYAMPADEPGLLESLKSQGYEVDDSEYCPPDWDDIEG